MFCRENVAEAGARDGREGQLRARRPKGHPRPGVSAERCAAVALQREAATAAGRGGPQGAWGGEAAETRLGVSAARFSCRSRGAAISHAGGVLSLPPRPRSAEGDAHHDLDAVHCDRSVHDHAATRAVGNDQALRCAPEQLGRPGCCIPER